MCSRLEDAEARPATVGAIRQMLEASEARHRSELEKHQQMLDQILAEVKIRSKVGSKEAAPRDSMTVPRESLRLSEMGPSRRKTEEYMRGWSGDSMLWRRESRFNMARALGFQHAEQQKNEANPPTEPRPPSSGGYRRSGSFISVRAKMSSDGGTGCKRIVRSPWVENTCGTVILINAILVGIQAHRRAMYPDQCEQFWETIFLLFNVFFIVEMLVRMCTFRKEFVCGPDWRWNLFDSLIVFSGIVEEIISGMYEDSVCIAADGNGGPSKPSAINGITALRIIRVLRIVRIVKALRTMSIFRELRVMVWSTLGCLVPLAWACLLLGFIQWCFSVYFLNLATDFVMQGIADEGIGILTDETKPFVEVRKYFGSLWLAIYTLFMSITGGINYQDATDALYAVTGMSHVIIVYMLFIALMVFAVLNVITGIFVENATRIALRDREIIIQDALERREKYKDDAMRVFEEADADGSGDLTEQEFEAHMQDERVQAFLENLELDASGARRMFRLLDLDGNGTVSAEEFVTGCMCLKGQAKTMDIAAILLEMNRMSHKMSAWLADLDSKVRIVSSGMGATAAQECSM